MKEKDLHITDILKNSLFFLGAGFSKPAGCKLSSEMLKDLEELSNDENNKVFLKSERKAIKFILSCLDYQARYRTLESNGKYSYYPNIEEFALLLRRIKNRENLLPYPVTGNWSDKIVMIEQDFKIENENPEMDIWSSIEEKIKKVCYNEWLKVDLEKLSYLSQLRDLIKKIDNAIKIDIFTLNNDSVLEDYFKDENSVYTGFVSNKWVGFERESIDDNTYNASRINYYKLHGSIDWVRLTDGSIKKVINNNDKLSEDEVELKPFLIFGHGTKIYTIDPFFSLLEYFKHALQKKKYFFVVGYSLFDPHINNLFFKALSESEDKLMLIINPKLNKEINESCFAEIYDIPNVLKKEYKSMLADHIANIQRNPIYTELPDFNIKRISPESFEYIKETTEDFISKIYNYLDLIKKQSYKKQEENNIF